MRSGDAWPFVKDQYVLKYDHVSMLQADEPNISRRHQDREQDWLARVAVFDIMR